MLGVTPNTVSRWAREGRLPSIQTLGGHHRFEAKVIEDLVRREIAEPARPRGDQDEQS
jgi:excisionase family DNA binding protein